MNLNIESCFETNKTEIIRHKSWKTTNDICIENRNMQPVYGDSHWQIQNPHLNRIFCTILYLLSTAHPIIVDHLQ